MINYLNLDSPVNDYCKILNITKSILSVTTFNTLKNININCINQDKNILCDDIDNLFLSIPTVPNVYYNKINTVLHNSLINIINCNNIEIDIKNNRIKGSIKNIFNIYNIIYCFILFAYIFYIFFKNKFKIN